MMSKIKNILKLLFEKIEVFHIYKYEKKMINKKKKLYSKVQLTDEQKAKIDKLYLENYGKKFSYKWHRVYQSYLNVFDEKYFPQILFSTKLEFKLNNKKMSETLQDKSLLELLYRGIDDLHFPQTYVLNCSGIYYDKNRNIISKSEALNILSDVGEVLIKPIVDSSSGRNVNIYNIKNSIDIESKRSVSDIFEQYKKNYIVQKCIKNCHELKTLNPSSLNTLRVVTYTINGRLYHCPISLRLGTNNSRVDNLHSGGICVGVSDDGFLGKYALREKGEVFEKHPDTNITFENYHIPHVNKIINIAYECHKRTPHQGIASWDFTINEKNQICLIEANLFGGGTWFLQCTNRKSLFGENTSYMLQLIANNKREKKR